MCVRFLALPRALAQAMGMDGQPRGPDPSMAQTAAPHVSG
jgi:hypothetical protein